MITENYLDPDVAYLLGLIAIRGTLYENPGDKRIVIEFPFKSLVVERVGVSVNQQQQLQIAAGEIRDRLYELLETDISYTKSPSAIEFTIRFLRNSLAWRNIGYLLNGERSYAEFEVPQAVMDTSEEVIQIEFLRGVADAGGFIRDSNRFLDGRRRVYIEVNNRNWILPIQLCALLQQHLDIPVQIIQWGHPNVRQPRVPQGSAWAKEHQVKIFAEAFQRVGFHVSYKQEILKEFIAEDLQRGGQLPPKCNPNPSIRRVKRKPRHPGEKSQLLPKGLQRKHFDSYWQICLAMGCHQCVERVDPQLVLLDEGEHYDTSLEEGSE